MRLDAFFLSPHRGRSVGAFFIFLFACLFFFSWEANEAAGVVSFLCHPSVFIPGLS